MKAARQFLEDGEIIPFANFPELLLEVIELEIEYPRLENVLPDLYNAIREFDLKKFLYAYSRLPKSKYGDNNDNEISDNDIYYRLRNSVLDSINKQKTIKLRDIKLVELLDKHNSLMAFALSALS